MTDALTCKNCGGTIDRARMICPYCGTQYRKDESYSPIHIETYTNPVRVLKSQVLLDEKLFQDEKDSEYISRLAVNNLVRNLTEGIKEMMELRTEADPAHCAVRITARLRVVEPKYLF